MSGLADTQRRLRDAIVSGETGAEALHLVGGHDPSKRMAIHQRHYRASLVGTLLTRFPALSWLVGSPAMADAANSYVRAHPPSAPCLAEYGDSFPAFVARHIGSNRPYVEPFGALEWHVGAVSIAVDAAVSAPASYVVEDHRLATATAVLQPGLRYLHFAWPVHDLMKRFLTDTAPDMYELRPAEAWIEVRGARGAFEINALDAGTWTFRADLQHGRSLETAVFGALAINAAFDPGAALATLMATRLLVDLTFPVERTAQ